MKKKLKKVKLKGNESFNFREGWLRKGMRLVTTYDDLFSRKDAMELLGVGSKMVKSIRFWLQATHLCEEGFANPGRKRVLYLTDDFGQVIFENDPYFEDLFTLSLLHFQIVKNESLCIAWNIFFNEFEAQEFTKENVVEMCQSALEKKMEENALFSESSFIDDCSSILRMYLAGECDEDPEESLSCPLSELGLLSKGIAKKGVYYRSSPSRQELDKLAVLYVITANLEPSKYSVSFEELLLGANNIGKVFHLNRMSMNEYLDQLRVAGYLTINRTAGLNMIYINKPVALPDIMRKYYEKAQMR